MIKNGYRNGCDDDFYALVDCLEKETIEELLSAALNHIYKWLEKDCEYFGQLSKWYRSWYGVNCLAPEQSFFNCFGTRYSYLKANASRLCELYEGLADYRSKCTLKTILEHWLTFVPDIRKSGIERTFDHYFDLDLFKCDESEVFVDCGCCGGDTVKSYVKSYGNRYQSIYSYEPAPSLYNLAVKELSEVERLHLRNAGVSNITGTQKMIDFGVNSGASRINPNGDVDCKTVRLDDDIKENITFLKMDIEGSEIDALMGAAQQIRRNKPKLAISLYHKFTDLLEIPRLVKQLNPEYKFYLRHFYGAGCPFPTEYCLLTVNGD